MANPTTLAKIEDLVGGLTSVFMFDNYFNVNTEEGYEILFRVSVKECQVETIKQRGQDITYSCCCGKDQGKWTLDGEIVAKPQQENLSIKANEVNEILFQLNPKDILDLVDDIQCGEVIHHIGSMQVIERIK